jgi:hypothetical protein
MHKKKESDEEDDDDEKGIISFKFHINNKIALNE